MRDAFIDLIAAIKNGTKESRADLTNAAPHTLNRPSAINNERLGKTVVQAYIAERLTHRKCFARRHQHAVEARSRGLNILDACGARAPEIGWLLGDDLCDPELLCVSIGGEGGLTLVYG